MTDKLDYVEIDREVAFERDFWGCFLMLEASVLFSALEAAVLLSQAPLLSESEQAGPSLHSTEELKAESH